MCLLVHKLANVDGSVNLPTAQIYLKCHRAHICLVLNSAGFVPPSLFCCFLVNFLGWLLGDMKPPPENIHPLQKKTSPL